MHSMVRRLSSCSPRWNTNRCAFREFQLHEGRPQWHRDSAEAVSRWNTRFRILTEWLILTLLEYNLLLPWAEIGVEYRSLWSIVQHFVKGRLQRILDVTERLSCAKQQFHQVKRINDVFWCLCHEEPFHVNRSVHETRNYSDLRAELRSELRLEFLIGLDLRKGSKFGSRWVQITKTKIICRPIKVPDFSKMRWIKFRILACAAQRSDIIARSFGRISASSPESLIILRISATIAVPFLASEFSKLTTIKRPVSLSNPIPKTDFCPTGVASAVRTRPVEVWTNSASWARLITGRLALSLFQ